MSETTMKRETKKAAKEREREEARATLRKLLPPGSRVYSILRNVSRSGMRREIDFYAFGADGPTYLTGYMATALDYSRSRAGAMLVSGCGMDVAYHVVHSLSYALHGMADVGEDAQEAGRRGRPFGPSADQYRAGYSLHQEAL